MFRPILFVMLHVLMSFNLGRVTDCEGRLRRDFVEFSRLWSAVGEDWLDDRRRRFEQEHLASLGPSLSRFAAALHEFSDAVRLADRQLQDDRSPAEELE